MKVKETIAFIGKADEICLDLIRTLASQGHPLLLVTQEDNHFSRLAHQILEEVPEADIETIGCVKEGCWEADIIVLSHGIYLDPQLLERVKEVATQKILVYHGGDESIPARREGVGTLPQQLPNTGIVQLTWDIDSREMTVQGADDPARVIARILTHAGYKINLLKTALD